VVTGWAIDVSLSTKWKRYFIKPANSLIKDDLWSHSSSNGGFMRRKAKLTSVGSHRSGGAIVVIA
jgi:hypothetical protein